MEEPEPPLILSPSTSLRRRSSDSNSPEFEFSNPSFTNFNILSADELFSGGVLLPLQHLHLSTTGSDREPVPDPESQPSTSELASSNKQDPPEDSGSDPTPVTEPESTAELSASTNSTFTSSKRWVRDIFKKIGDDLQTNSKEKGNNNNSVKEKKREKKNGTGVNGVNTAELNINIWPFSRSRSAGNSGTRPRSTAASSTTTRKVSSAPCSRSNSRGESKSRKWPNSPNRAGVHLGKSSPVWQARRSVSRTAVKKDGNEDRQRISGGGSRGRVLSLNVPMCIGYRQRLSCGSDENVAISATTEGAPGGGRNVGGVTGEGVRGSNLFKIRGLFTKKVY
ncbi:hypothetical protein ACJIZ3_012784 [Penstemon smallii]|uniref:Uncharacterized protein n=1 Tax=Penstemon smallii TaxID=265156 RepID=A0ABD3UP56_9LAMI